MAVGVVDSLVERRGRVRAARTQVHHRRPVIDGPVDTGYNSDHRPEPLASSTFTGISLTGGAPGYTGNANAVIGRAAAMPATCVRPSVVVSPTGAADAGAGDAVRSCYDAAGQVGVVEADAESHHGDHDRAVSPRDGPGSGRVDLQQVPLRAVPNFRIVGRGHRRLRRVRLHHAVEFRVLQLRAAAEFSERLRTPRRRNLEAVQTGL